ncbi:MAG: dihydrolipoamide acetyltransferase family protein [Pseudomonadota bacterium]
MSQYVFKVPDLGEGTVEAEIGEWHVKVGDIVKEDDVIVDMMTDKAAVEIPSPVSGRIASLHGVQGDIVAVGTNLIVFDLDGSAPATAEDEATEPAIAESKTDEVVEKPAKAPATAPVVRTNGRVQTSPAVRAKAKKAGIDLTDVPGSGARGRILARDLEQYIAAGGRPASATPIQSSLETDEVDEHRVIGVRRVIARKMSEAKRNIPHFTYVEEIDITEFDALRAHMNATRDDNKPKLTFLPLLITALAKTLRQFPQCNAVYDAEREVVVRHKALHVGIATQTKDGLKVPVVHQAQAKTLWQLADAIKSLSDAARTGKASKDQLTGSTITITSLGALGGIVTTPVINSPEVGIVGINKAVDRPVVKDGQIVVRKMMNISVSFDHRFVDGYDAAAMVQVLKGLIEYPATIFTPD